MIPLAADGFCTARSLIDSEGHVSDNISEKLLRRVLAAGTEPLARFAAVAALSVSIAGLSATIFSDKVLPAEDYTSSLNLQRYQELSKTVRAQIERSDDLAKRIASEKAADPLRTSEFEILQRQVAELSARQQRIERVILTNPAKALEVPMLRRDVESNAKGTGEALASMQHSVDRVYDQNKYVMLTIFASIVLLAISTFIKSGKKAD
jgi:hypothetical protein